MKYLTLMSTIVYPHLLMSLRLSQFLFYLIFGISLAHCRFIPKIHPQNLSQFKTPSSLLQASKEAYEKASQNLDKQKSVFYAKTGFAYANRCLVLDPTFAPCLYFRALNTGIYFKNHVLGYQKGLQAMVRDLKKVISLDPDFDHAGAFRVLGALYTKAPSFSTDAHGITQDLDLSAEYLKQATHISPEYALNYLLLADSLFQMGELDQAKDALNQFDHFFSSNIDIEYPNWKKERDFLIKKLRKN